VPLLYRLEGVRNKPNCAYAFGVLLVAVALVPLAYASPPDPVWVAGIHDCADFDDTIEAAVSSIGLVARSKRLFGAGRTPRPSRSAGPATTGYSGWILTLSDPFSPRASLASSTQFLFGTSTQ